MNNYYTENLKKSNSIIKNIFELLKPYKMHITASFLLSIVITLLTLLLPFISEKLIDDGIMPLNVLTTVKLASTIILITIFSNFFSLVQSIIHINFKNQLNFNLQMSLLRKIFLLQLDIFKEKGFQAIFDSLNFDIDNISEVADKNFLLSAMDIFKVIGGLIALIIINYKLTFFILLMIPLKYIITTSLSKIKINFFNKFLESFENIGKWYVDIINGIKEIKLWNMHTCKEKEYSALLLNKISLEKKVQILDESEDFNSIMLEGILFNLIYILGVLLASNNEMTVGGIIAFASYSNIVTEPLSSLISIKYRFANVKPSIDNYCDFMMKKQEDNNSTLDLPKYIDKISFKNVSLKFNAKKTLKNLNLEFNKGEKIAIIGTNGSGKTSLINLLLRFYLPSEGNILINNNIDINTIDINKYRDLFAVVSQDVYLFNTTIKNNIDFSNELTDEELLAWAKENQLSSFLDFSKKSKATLDSIVGVNGEKLSGGEKQKISFLRALLKKNRQILILDEATASYDSQSEELFNKIVTESNNYLFTFVISHKTDILKHMDKIILLDNGTIKFIGDYNSLLSETDFITQEY